MSTIFRWLTLLLLALAQITKALLPLGVRTRPLLRTLRPLSVSVGPAGGGDFQNDKKPLNNFIISPISKISPLLHCMFCKTDRYFVMILRYTCCTGTSEAEMIIMNNFNSIQLGGSRKLAVIGTQTLTDQHMQMIELLSYALVLSGNHIYTSGGGATNSAVIRGALRACNSNLLTVILPQSLGKQPPEMQPLLMRVADLIQQPQFDDLDFKEAAANCNSKILDAVDEVLTFVYHDSSTVIDAIDKMPKEKTATKFFLD